MERRLASGLSNHVASYCEAPGIFDLFRYKIFFCTPPFVCMIRTVPSMMKEKRDFGVGDGACDLLKREEVNDDITYDSFISLLFCNRSFVLILYIPLSCSVLCLLLFF